MPCQVSAARRSRAKEANPALAPSSSHRRARRVPRRRRKVTPCPALQAASLSPAKRENPAQPPRGQRRRALRVPRRRRKVTPCPALQAASRSPAKRENPAQPPRGQRRRALRVPRRRRKAMPCPAPQAASRSPAKEANPAQPLKGQRRRARRVPRRRRKATPCPASKEGPAPLRKGLTGKCLVRVKARLARHWVAKVLRMACPAARCPCPKRGGRPQGLSRNSPNGRRSRSGSIYPRRFIARRIQAVCRRRGIRRSKRSPGARLNRPSLGTRHPSRPSNGIHRRRRNNGIRRNKRNNGARLNRFSLGTRHPSRPSNGIHRRSRHKGGSSATAASPACRLAPNGLPVNARPSCAAPLGDKAHRAPRAEKGYRDQSRRALRPKDRLALRGAGER